MHTHAHKQTKQTNNRTNKWMNEQSHEMHDDIKMAMKSKIIQHDAQAEQIYCGKQMIGSHFALRVPLHSNWWRTGSRLTCKNSKQQKIRTNREENRSENNWNRRYYTRFQSFLWKKFLKAKLWVDFKKNRAQAVLHNDWKYYRQEKCIKREGAQIDK